MKSLYLSSGINEFPLSKYLLQSLPGYLLPNSSILDNKNYGILVTAYAAYGNEAHRNNIVGNGWGIQKVDFDVTCSWYGDVCGLSVRLSQPAYN